MRSLHFQLINKGIYQLLAIVGLMLASINPTINFPRDFKNYVFVIDITQSMNVEDMRSDKQAISRLNFALKLIQATIKELSCGTKVSIALFANAEIVPLYVPLEICTNHVTIDDTLSHIEWRMAWRGSSHLRLGLIDASRILLLLPEPAQIIFLTDGDEAAPINAITKIDLSPMPDSNGWLLAGIGSLTASPIPKLNSKNEIIGFWSQYATKIEPSQIVSEESLGKRDDSIATDPREYYLSALNEEYLKEVTNDIGATYVRADSKEHFLAAINELPVTGYGRTPTNIGWVYAILAIALIFVEYLPIKPIG